MRFNQSQFIFKSEETYSVYSQLQFKNDLCLRASRAHCFTQIHSVGQGQVAFLLGIPVLSNTMIGRAQNSHLAFRLNRDFSPLAIDEYHHFFSQYNFWDLLRTPQFSIPMIGFLLLMLTYFLFAKSRLHEQNLSEQDPVLTMGYHHLSQNVVASEISNERGLRSALALTAKNLSRLYPQHSDEIQSIGNSSKNRLSAAFTNFSLSTKIRSNDYEVKIMIDSYTRQCHQKIVSQLGTSYILDQEALLQNILIAYLARGHVLIEGPPGTAKTLTAKLLAKTLSKSFKRIQFTSDLLPGDILGASIYSPEKREFQFIKGPLFSDFIVADEMNRTPPRTQSALLEAMEERQVTAEGNLMRLSPIFLWLPRKTPKIFEGTFPLPEVQLDRFLMKLKVEHAQASTEAKILGLIVDGKLPPVMDDITQHPLDREQIDREVKLVRVDESLKQYIAQIVAHTRKHPSLSSGSSVRGAIALLSCSRLLALVSGRDFVIPDDIKLLAASTLCHRIRVSPEARLSSRA